MKKFIIPALFLFFVCFHYYRIHQAEKHTAMIIFSSLRNMEIEVTADIPDESGDKIYFSPVKYAKRLAIMDCESMVYEKYRLWE